MRSRLSSFRTLGLLLVPLSAGLVHCSDESSSSGLGRAGGAAGEAGAAVGTDSGGTPSTGGSSASGGSSAGSAGVPAAGGAAVAGSGGAATGGSESGGSAGAASGGSESGGSGGDEAGGTAGEGVGGTEGGGSAGDGGAAGIAGAGPEGGAAGLVGSGGGGGEAGGGAPNGGSGGAAGAAGARGGAAGGLNAAECENWQTEHPAWIFCDDFDSGDPLVATGRYFEHTDNEGDFVPVAGVGLDGSVGMRGLWQTDEVDAGSLKVAFGRNPNGYMDNGIRPTEDFREIYYRMYLRMQPGWVGSPAKLSRATVFYSASEWSQAMIAHIWSDDAEHLIIDPVSCVSGGTPVCTGYNDFDNMSWLGIGTGTTPLFATSNSGTWYCIEAHVRLNDPGSANGIQEFWIDGNLEVRSDTLDFVGTYQDYAINAVFFENYWNDGSPQEQERYFDNIVISTEPIGCL